MKKYTVGMWMKKIIAGTMLCIMSMSIIGCNYQKTARLIVNTVKNQWKNEKDEDENTYNFEEKYTELQTTEITTEENLISINPFEKIKVSYLGSSPFLKVNLDTSMCSEEEQEIINYYYDDIYYKIGDTVTVQAFLYEENEYSNKYVLEEESREFTIENTTKWLTSVEDVDFSVLDTEILDKLASETTETAGSWDFGGEYLESVIVTVPEPKLKATYFVSLKPSRYSDFDCNSEYAEFNYYIRIYDFELEMDGTNNISQTTVSCAVIVKNIKQDIDGTLTYDTSLGYVTEVDNYDQLINNVVISKREEFNVSEIQ